MADSPSSTNPMKTMNKPVIGITTDVDPHDARRFVRPGYARCVALAGGVPVVLSTETAAIPEYIDLCDAFLFTGGDDPVMEEWGIATHPDATKVHPDRQLFELSLLRALDHRPAVPVLGICLGMQYMALHAGGKIDQHLHDTSSEIAKRHWGKVEHEVDWHVNETSEVMRHSVFSHHRQAIVDSGTLSVCAQSAKDGLIEAVCNTDRPFYLGVQWHPEHTPDDVLGAGLFRSLVQVCTVAVNS